MDKIRIPRDAWHRPLLHEDLTPNKECWLWESTQLEPYLAYYYPECYEFIKKSNGQSEKEQQA